ncbi:hypothetical protein FB451DRAFT_1507005 [Mycena latifolia]|nr:hypothetical protein FB451DRAFT_1507005 [Mycena latifolia]
MSTPTPTPPTTHALSRAERLRLMRSTRKLGALLGETPLLAEIRPAGARPSSKASHGRSASTMSAVFKPTGRLVHGGQTITRSASFRISTALPVSQATPAPEPARPAPGATSARPILFLDLPVPGPGGLTTPAERTPLPSPLSDTSSIVFNAPPTPSEDAHRRRRKMARVVRTLGENVPPELVFPAAPPKARRRASIASVRECTFEQHYNGPSAACDAEEPFAVPFVILPGPEDRVSSETDVPQAPHMSQEHLLPPSESGMRRREQGWSGEWGGNVENMEDVVRRLRGLRLK